jgi:hypothetical protein
MPDMKLKCVDCGKEFVFTEGEQTYYRERGLAIPKRCSGCRLKRRSGIGKRPVDVKLEKPEQEEIPQEEKEEKEEEGKKDK